MSQLRILQKLAVTKLTTYYVSLSAEGTLRPTVAAYSALDILSDNLFKPRSALAAEETAAASLQLKHVQKLLNKEK